MYPNWLRKIKWIKYDKLAVDKVDHKMNQFVINFG